MLRVKTLTQNKFFWPAVFILSLAIFVGLAIGRTHQPLTYDDFWLFTAAKTLASQGSPHALNYSENYADHPLLQVFLISGMFKLLGTSEFAARAVGIISGILSIILVFILARLASPLKDARSRNRLAVLTSLLYALSPSTIQSPMTLLMDTMSLVPAILFLILCTIKYFQTEKNLWLCLNFLATAAIFWLKLVTPLVAVAILAVLSLLTKNSLRTKIKYLGSLIGGTALFIITWYFYCRFTNTSFRQPFIFSFYTLIKISRPKTPLTSFGLSIIYLGLWLSFFTLFATGLILLRKARTILRNFNFASENFFLIFSLVIILGFCLAVGPTFAFPRYNNFAIPLLFIAVALSLSKDDFQRLDLRKITAIIAAAFLIQVWVAGDLLYVLRLNLREYQIFKDAANLAALKITLLRVVGAVLFYLALFLLWRKIISAKNLVGFLILLAIGSNLGTVFLQSRADYHTGFNYGQSGLKETIEYIRQGVPESGVVIGPREIIYYLHSPNSPMVPNILWASADSIKDRLLDPKVSALAYSVNTNTMEQIRNILKNQDFLQQNFKPAKIGTFYTWLRK